MAVLFSSKIDSLMAIAAPKSGLCFFGSFFLTKSEEYAKDITRAQDNVHTS